MADKILTQAPVIVEKQEQVEVDCPICFNVMVEPVTLPCGHTFCYNCLKKAFKDKMMCPMDRHELPGDYELKIDKEY